MALLALIAAFFGGHHHHHGCLTQACERRVDRREHRKTLRRWWQATRPYRGWLAAVRSCESGSFGTYDLSTTGNGFWFAYQHTASSWRAAGGRLQDGWRPVGVRSTQPEPLEQDYRAVVTLHQQGTGAWPVCGR